MEDDWRGLVACVVAERIRSVCRGRWPRTDAEWARVAKRFGRGLRIERQPTLDFAGLAFEGLIVVEAGLETHRRICHELAEAALEDGDEPLMTPSRDLPADRHRIAVMVESLYASQQSG